VGCAFSDEKSSVRTQTTVEAKSGTDAIFVNGKRASGPRGAGMLKVVGLLKKKAGYIGGLKISSQNHDIPTGSSDSGAAALATALNDFLGLNLPLHGLLSAGRHGSETAFRSLYGGVSEYIIEGRREPFARQVASPKELFEIVFYGVNFKGSRHSADELHLGVVKHPKYRLRSAQVKERIDSFCEALRTQDFARALALVEADAKTVHAMFREVGLPVRNKEMLALCNKIELWRADGTPVYWNVAGGNTVYALTLKKHSNKIAGKLKAEDHKPTKYMMAGGPELL
jgi:diphosphomevalonate decarboxylase